MGNLFSIPLDGSINKVFEWLVEKGGYIHNLEQNLEALKTAMDVLNAKQEDLSRRVTREEDSGLQRLAQIQVWFNSVDDVKEKVNGLLSVEDVELQRLCLCQFCSKSLISSYRYGKKVFFTLQEVEKLKCSGDFEVVAEQPQTSEVQERPLERIIVGQERMLDKAWKHFTDDGVGIMGLHGMGGVGKTTLLTQLNNKFVGERLGFDFVIWIVVSKELQVEKIQDEIAKKIGREEWKQKDKSQKAEVIHNFLRKKKFVLFVDDIWEKVDLGEIGIPNPTTVNKCKVVFTTRSLDVCASMGVEDPMEVKCLTDDEAFDLFQQKVGQRTLGSDPGIPDLARIVAKKCYGLPLALNVIGETMSSKRTIQEWRDAIRVLNSYATRFKGMKDKILPLLKFSYDNLKEEHSYDNLIGEHLQSCLLYCALFPEDYEIPKDRLIDYWICEGIIDGSEGVESVEDKGYDIIGSLVRASLLMDHVNYVCMHDVVREMALWIASDFGEKREAFIVCAGVGLTEMPKVENWKIVRRMSLMNNEIKHLAGMPECLELTTLLMQGNNDLEKISSEFFRSMSKLAVLDLSRNRAPSESLDGISELCSLQYLNLSYTGIDYLPMGMEKLIHLDLEYTYQLKSIVGISRLHRLKVLKIAGSGISLDHDTLTELGTLQQLEILTIEMEDPQLLEQFLRSHRLMHCTRLLSIKNMNMELSGISLPVAMDKLREFFIQHSRICKIKMTSFASLSKVYIFGCECLRELTLLMYAPNLKDLSVFESDQIEDIIKKERAREGEESGIVPFPNLISLTLYSLPELTNIYWRPLPFPCLEEFTVCECPKLKKLPVNYQSGKRDEDKLIIRYGEKRWIESVEWEDEATKTRFLSSCEED